MWEEKRTSRRVSVKIITNCAKKQNQASGRMSFLSFTKDLSLLGARFSMPGKVKAGERIILSLEMPAYFIPLLTFGEIVWVKDKMVNISQAQPAVEAGVRFLKVELFDQSRLRQFLDSTH